jgi:hypothetical protein
MPGTTSVSSSSTDTPTPAGVRDDVDLDATVWFGGGDAYHRATEWGPACVDQIGRLDEHTLGDAVDEGKRPCRQCEPVDYRRVATDGGVHVGTSDEDLAAHGHANDLEAALDYVMEAARRAEELGVDDVAKARLQLAECGARLGFYATSDTERELVLDDAREHLEAAVDAIVDDDVTHPARHALQFYVARDELREPEPAPAPRPSTSSTTSTPSPLRLLAPEIAGTLSILSGVFAGLALAKADFVSTVETSAGDAIVTSAPGAPFWAGLGLMSLATLLVAVATTTAGGRR